MLFLLSVPLIWMIAMSSWVCRQDIALLSVNTSINKIANSLLHSARSWAALQYSQKFFFCETHHSVILRMRMWIDASWWYGALPSYNIPELSEMVWWISSLWRVQLEQNSRSNGIDSLTSFVALSEPFSKVTWIMASLMEYTSWVDQ